MHDIIMSLDMHDIIMSLDMHDIIMSLDMHDIIMSLDMHDITSAPTSCITTSYIEWLAIELLMISLPFINN